MKKVSIALMGIGVAAISQQATGKIASEIQVSSALVDNQAKDLMKVALKQRYGKDLAQLADSLSKHLVDDEVSIDVDGAIKLAGMTTGHNQDQTVRSGTAARSIYDASACYTNCHRACHGSRSWR